MVVYANVVNSNPPYMGIKVQLLPLALDGGVSGFFGNSNGNMSDDLVVNGQRASIEAFGETWRVGANQSMIPSTLSCALDHFPLDSVNSTLEAVEKCRGLSSEWIADCEYDLTVMPDEVSSHLGMYHAVMDTGVLGIPPAPFSVVVELISNATCSSTGTLEVTTRGGGEPPFTYEWLPSGVFANSILNGPPGTYRVKVTDSLNRSVFSYQTQIFQGDPLPTLSLITQINETCFGDSSGSLTVAASGGTAPYYFQWDQGGALASSMNSNLKSGSYSVVVTDARGCAASQSYVVSFHSRLTLTDSVSMPSCATPLGGAVNLTVTGGIAPLTFLWSNGVSTENLSGVGAGNYSVTVSDSIGCARSLSFALFVSETLQIALDALVDETCFGDSTGSLSVSASGGIAPYNFQWGVGSAPTSSLNTNLTSGTYTVVVTDSGVCQVSRLVEFSLLISDL